MATSSKLDLRKAGYEIAAIVFAVLLALWLEGWREDAERQERANAFLERIRSEIQQNRDELQIAMTENQAYIEGIQTVLISEKKIEFSDIAPFVQIEGASTRDAAWQSAQMTQSIANMPAETVAVLAGLYDTQDYYADYMSFFFQRFIDLAMDMRPEATRGAAMRKFQQHLAVSNSLARQLMAEYDTFLAESGTQ